MSCGETVSWEPPWASVICVPGWRRVLPERPDCPVSRVPCAGRAWRSPLVAAGAGAGRSVLWVCPSVRVLAMGRRGHPGSTHTREQQHKRGPLGPPKLRQALRNTHFLNVSSVKIKTYPHPAHELSCARQPGGSWASGTRRSFRGSVIISEGRHGLVAGARWAWSGERAALDLGL